MIGLRAGSSRVATASGGADHRAEVRAVVAVDRSRNGDDVDVGAGGVGGSAGQPERRGGERFRLDLAGAVDAEPQLLDPPLVDVEADDAEAARERDGEREADIAEADDDDLLGAGGVHFRITLGRVAAGSPRFRGANIRRRPKCQARGTTLGPGRAGAERWRVALRAPQPGAVLRRSASRGRSAASSSASCVSGVIPMAAASSATKWTQLCLSRS